MSIFEAKTWEKVDECKGTLLSSPYGLYTPCKLILEGQEW